MLLYKGATKSGVHLVHTSAMVPGEHKRIGKLHRSLRAPEMNVKRASCEKSLISDLLHHSTGSYLISEVAHVALLGLLAFCPRVVAFTRGDLPSTKKKKKKAFHRSTESPGANPRHFHAKSSDWRIP
ncbi:predicted protein [Uncinocarpus reesii 1704]|uniref:Uncharacterized protein n=1 Tax=Uncinocarpus reesii (strain UAMH 1704) TaxID=336963 RepID=C4JFM6_UNCRE|nr:uncharacterized protein UREG_02360 [Uncinocarpus reesii 1704]EEP77511.1 predicted protein [Uncinocarpus reesii 1704]